MYEVIITILLAYIVVHFTKYFTAFIKKDHSWHDFFKTGGMPSAHAATVISLATIVFLLEGLNSAAFGVSVVLAILVIRDAMGVRRSVGEQGILLKKLAKKNKMKTTFHHNMGHTPAQVLVGSILGFVIALIVYFI